DRAARDEPLRERRLSLLVGARVLEAVRDLDEHAVGVGRVDAAERLDLGLEDAVADAHAAGAVLEVELELDRRDDRLGHGRTDDRDDLEQRVAVLAGERLAERVQLLLAGARVEEGLELAIPLVQRTRPAHDARPAQTGEVDVAEVALVDPHRDNALAVTVRRVLVEVARAPRRA